MILAELEEVDLPIIYDLLKAKLTAGQYVRLPYDEEKLVYQVIQVKLIYQSTGAPKVRLTWNQFDHLTGKWHLEDWLHLPDDLNSWRLVKIDAGWELHL
jgi:hypothetical protein